MYLRAIAAVVAAVAVVASRGKHVSTQPSHARPDQVSHDIAAGTSTLHVCWAGGNGIARTSLGGSVERRRKDQVRCARSVNILTRTVHSAGALYDQVA